MLAGVRQRGIFYAEGFRVLHRVAAPAGGRGPPGTLIPQRSRNSMYRVTIQVVTNLPLTSKHKFRFNMRSLYFYATLCFGVNGRFETTGVVTLYKATEITWEMRVKYKS